MAMSRSLGWTLLTTRSPIEIVPEVMFSSPASIRNKVDLPHPEGPTTTTKAPSSIGIDPPCRTSNPPNDFRTSRICTDDIDISLPKHTTPEGKCPGCPLIYRGLTRIFWQCRWIKVVRVGLKSTWPGNVADGALTCKHRRPTRTLRTKTRRVRCGRKNEQAAYRGHQTQTSFQRMV